MFNAADARLHVEFRVIEMCILPVCITPRLNSYHENQTYKKMEALARMNIVLKLCTGPYRTTLRKAQIPLYPILCHFTRDGTFVI